MFSTFLGREVGQRDRQRNLEGILGARGGRRPLAVDRKRVRRLALRSENRVRGCGVEVWKRFAAVGKPLQWWSSGNVGIIWNGNE